MDHLPTRKEDLQHFHNNELMVRQTAEQVIKDFGQFGIDIYFPENLQMAYNSLFDQLSPQIKELMNNNLTRFYSLLYRIDLNEGRIKTGIYEMPQLPIFDVITHLILERELQKVLTRHFFKEKL